METQRKRLIFKRVLLKRGHLSLLLTFVGLVFLSGTMVFLANLALYTGSSISMEMFVAAGPSFFYRFIYQSIITLGLMLVFSLIVFSVYLHQIVGPIERLERWLQSAIDGDVKGPITFRKGDKFEKIGQLLESYRNSKSKK